MRTKVLFVATILTVSLAPLASAQVAWRSKTSVTVLKEAPAKPADAEIEVLASEPKEREFEDLCMITATGGQTIANPKKGSKLFEKIKKDARKCGADAIIIRSSEDMTWKPLRSGIDQGAKAQAVAIRYKD